MRKAIWPTSSGMPIASPSTKPRASAKRSPAVGGGGGCFFVLLLMVCLSLVNTDHNRVVKLNPAAHMPSIATAAALPGA
jgi:hypothetical protein